MQRLQIAGLAVEYETQFQEGIEELLTDYRPHQKNGDEPVVRFGKDVVEFYELSVALGEQLPLLGRLQTHGVAIEYDGKAYIFSAPSGIGKSTRAFLWQKYLGEDKVAVINGDKPILWFRDETVLACGSPWSGKEGLSKNVCVPLGGLCLLKRSSDNTIRRASDREFFDAYSTQIQMPADPQAMMAALSLLEELYAKVPVFVLENDMSGQGVKVAFEALTGKDFEKHRI